MNKQSSPPVRTLVSALLVAGLLLAALWSVAFAAQPVGVEQSATATPRATPRPAATAAATEAVTDTEPAAEAGSSAGSDVAAGGGTIDAELADLEEFEGVPVGFTAEGYPFIGDPAAPVVLVEWSDYLCPFCGRHFLETKPLLIEEYVAAGQMRMVFRDFPIPSLHPLAQEGHVAAHCVGENGAAAYWAMHNALFAGQSAWTSSVDPSAFLRAAAEEAGAEMDAYDECIADGRTADRVAADMQEGAQRGFTGTPTFTWGGAAFGEVYTLVGAYPIDSFRQWADLMAAGEVPPQEAEAEAQAAQLPPWAQAENLMADPNLPGRNLNGDHTMGSDDATVTIIEFSDFQCPACALHATEVQPQITAEYIETGLVRWVFKHRPLSIHPFAPLGSAAAICAANQGAFWEMHDLLYAEQATWAPDNATWTAAEAEAEITELAKELELDTDSFSECINGRQALEEVLFDVFDAEGIISSTPSFIVLYNGEGTLVNGSRPYPEFKELLDSVLAMTATQE